MATSSNSSETFGAALAAARREGRLADLRLGRIMTMDEAEAVQSAAVAAYGGARVGYAVEGTDALARRRLGLSEPVFGPVLDSDLVASGARFRLPYGILGAGCGIIFGIGRRCPEGDEAVDIESLSAAIVDCRPAISLVGRRVPGAVPLNTLTATADFALDVLHVEGARVRDFALADFSAAAVTARIDGNVVGAAAGRTVVTGPLEATAWLACELGRRGRTLEPGDLVAAASPIGILQVMPGQVFEADFGLLGRVSVTLE